MSEEKIQNYSLSILGLQLVDYFRTTSHQLFGVAVYHPAEVKGESIDLNMFSQELKAEFAGVLIPELSLVIVAMYRSPSGHANVFLGLLELCLTF